MKKLRRFFFIFGPAMLWLSVIFLFSSYPTVKTSELYWWDFLIKKTAHIVEYFILAVLVFRSLLFYKGRTLAVKTIFIICFLFCFLYGVSDEFHQSFIPGREARLRDVLIDSAGIALAIWYIKRSFPKAPAKLVNWVLAGQRG